MSKQSKTERKEMLRAIENAANVSAELKRERRLGEDVHWAGVGELTLQMREVSSFGEGCVCDIRSVSGEFKAYLSVCNPERPGYLLPGYQLLDLESKSLELIVSQVLQAAPQCLLSKESGVGLDGTSYSVRIAKGFSGVAFSWLETEPEEWKVLTQCVCDVISKFMVASPKDK